jgi:hypothetical protein
VQGCDDGWWSCLHESSSRWGIPRVHNVKQTDFISAPRIVVARYLVCWPRLVCTFGEFNYLCFWGDVCACEASFQ